MCTYMYVLVDGPAFICQGPCVQAVGSSMQESISNSRQQLPTLFLHARMCFCDSARVDVEGSGRQHHIAELGTVVIRQLCQWQALLRATPNTGPDRSASSRTSGVWTGRCWSRVCAGYAAARARA